MSARARPIGAAPPAIVLPVALRPAPLSAPIPTLIPALVSVLLLWAGGWAAAQPPTPTFRTRSEGVRVEVLVTDGEKPVAGLTAKDFVLVDSGVRQEVEVSSLADTPLDVILVLDTSTSLGADGLAHLTRAADTLCARLRPVDRAALVTFSEDVTIRAALTPRHARVRALLEDLEVRGTTSVIDASYTGMILQSDAGRPTMLLVFTDGLDTASWLAPSQVLEIARRTPVVPYAVVTGTAAFRASIGRFVPRGPHVLLPPTLESRDSLTVRQPGEATRFVRDLVAVGGGLLLDADSPRRLEQRFEEALDSFRRRYVLTYVPRGVERQGWHPLEIRVDGDRYRVRARAGYALP